MGDESTWITDRVQELGEIELAALLCLITEEHCIIEAEAAEIDNVEQELRLMCAHTFGLSCAVVDCSEETSLDDFGDGVVIENEDDAEESLRTTALPSLGRNFRDGEDSIFPSTMDRSTQAPTQQSAFHNGKIANVIVAKNLNLTHNQIQIRALELIRGKRMFTRTSIQMTPKRFLFIALLSANNGPRLVQHLNDQMSISHVHSSEDLLPNVEGLSPALPASDGRLSANSAGRVPPSPSFMNRRIGAEATFSKDDIDTLIHLASKVRLHTDVRCYLHDIVVFLRTHRAVASGISALATRHFNALILALAPLHNIDFVPPSLVALAARKIYPHRITITTPEDEPSTQWGSSIEAAAELLQGITVEDIIEEVLQSVEAPL